MQTVKEHGNADTVLVIDDDVAQLKTLSDILETEDMLPVCCENADEALNICKKQDVNVAILDLRLGDEDGMTLLKKLQELNPEMRVIINTAYASLESAMMAVNHEAFAYVRKLGNLDELIGHVHRAHHEYLTKYSAKLENEVKKQTGKLVRMNQRLKKDITERKLAQYKLRESEEKYRSLVENAPDTIINIDPTGTILSINRTPPGISRESLIGKKFLDYISKDDQNRVMKILGRVLKTGKSESYENKGIIKGRWYSSSIGPLKKGGKVTGAVLITRDITDEKEAKEELDETRRMLEAIVEQAPIPIAVVKPDGTVLFINPACKKLLGIDDEPDIRPGVNFFNFEPSLKIYDTDGQLVSADQLPLALALKGIATGGKEIRVAGKDGGEAWVIVHAAPIYNDKEELIAGLVMFPDVTELRVMKDHLRQSEKMRVIGQLAGGVAHDFNNQLGATMGYADLIREEVGNDAILARYADNIILSVKRSTDLTSKLLAFSRQGKYVSVSVNIHSIIAEVISILSHSILKKIKLKHNLNANPPVTTGDPNQIQNALLNLALNARDAMPKGGELTFSTDVVILDEEYCKTSHYEIKPGRYLKIYVADTGVGMDEETRKHIFEPFYTTKEIGKGSGMGLAAIYGTVKNHGGSINVFSEIGRGTTVKVYLPLTVAEEEAVTDNAQMVPIKGTANILVVDDEEMLLEAIVYMLKSLGYKVTARKNGAEAVEYYKKSWKRVDLVILDLIMPEMDGRETFLAMRKINHDVKVILSSGYSIDGDARKVLEEGAMSFIQKPFEKTALSQVVAEVLEK